MNTPVGTNPPTRIAALLANTRVPVLDHGPASWSLQPARPDAQVTARWVADWLQLESGPLAPAPAVAAGFLPETLLRWNSALAGTARFGLDARFDLALRAEVPWLEDYDPGPRLSESWAGIEHGLALLGGGTGPDAGEMATAAAADLKAVAEAAAWPFHERQDGRLDFSLPETDAALQAAAQARPDGSVRVWLALASLDGLGDTPRRALAVLLLRAGAVLRLARPVFLGDATGAAAELEVVFATAPEPRELALALESLAVGAALAAAETRLLCHEQMAKEFLTVGNWTPQETNHNQQPKDHAW